MTKREQAINSTELLLQYVLTGQGASIPIGCQFVDADYLAGGLYNALELLKEREPAKGEKPIRYGLVFWKCNACSMIITEGDKFCRECGKAVKWE